MGNISFEELVVQDENKEANKDYESPFNTESRSKSMPGDEIESLSRFDADETDDDDTKSEHKEEFSKADEEAADNVLDELPDMANSQNADMHASADNPPQSDPLIEESVPRMVVDALEERLPKMLSDTLKIIIPDLLKVSVNKALPNFDKRVKKTLKAQVPELILKPLNKELSALNTLENNRMVDLQKKLTKAIHTKVGKSVQRNEDIVVNGMHRNLVPPPGVMGSRGLVIKEIESGIFFYNRNFDLVFQREKKFHLATTAQLIRIRRTIKRDTPEGKQMYKKMEFVIEARNDVVEARKIVKDNLDNLGQQIWIQVRDIVKEVEDYLKTYSSAGMDISCLSTKLVKAVNSWQNCSLKYGRDVFKNGRAFNAVALPPQDS
ncbi:hypothetical protein Tco_0630989 [Tanacetum coccineum]